MNATRRTQGRTGIGGEAEQAGCRDEECRGHAGEGVGADVAFCGVGPGRVGPDPGDAFEGGAAHLPAAGVELYAEGTAEVVEGEVDGAGVVAGGGGDLRDVAPAGGAGRAVEVLFAEGVWSCGSWSE